MIVFHPLPTIIAFLLIVVGVWTGVLSARSALDANTDDMENAERETLWSEGFNRISWAFILVGSFMLALTWKFG